MRRRTIDEITSAGPRGGAGIFGGVHKASSAAKRGLSERLGVAEESGRDEVRTSLLRSSYSHRFAKAACSAVLAASLTVGLFGCSGSVESSDSSADAVATSSEEASFESVAAEFDVANLDLAYSDRDMDASYDDSSATHIALSGTSASVEGEGASVDGGTVTISQAGTYVVSGSLSDGQLVVDAPDDAKVQIVLAGVSITYEDGPAIYAKNADKCFVTLEDGTENALSDGTDYVLEEDSDEPYATLFSNCDLTLNGSGSLTVTANYRHGICSKDDLVVTGGTINVTAVEDALRGHDSVKIADGTFNLVAGGDAVKSNKDTKATKGFVNITGGTFSIQAGDKAVKAETYIGVSGGSFNITSGDDAFHSNLEMAISGGTFSVTAGDDAFHAETVLTIDDGTIDVASCYEGYEAEKVYVNGGTTHIVAIDDALNASAADLTGDDSSTTEGEGALPEAPGDAGAAAAGGGQAPEAPADGQAPSASGSSNGGAAPGASNASREAMPAGQAPGASGQGGAAPDGGASQGEMPQQGAAQSSDAAVQPGGNGGQGDLAGGNAPGQTDDNCLIQINGGYIEIDAQGDGVDSNGNVEVTGGVLLVNGTTSNGDGAFDYDGEATVTGGTVVMVGSTGMAQNFSGGTQPFLFSTDVSGNAGDTVAIVDESGNVVASFTASKAFAMVCASSPALTEGGSYSVVVGGTVTGANADGYTDSGTVTGGASTTVTASTAPSSSAGAGMRANPSSAGFPNREADFASGE